MQRRGPRSRRLTRRRPHPDPRRLRRGRSQRDGLAAQVFGPLHCTSRPYIPARADGYSFSAASVKAIKDGGFPLVISVDNGTNAIELIAELQRSGVDVIVTDHHGTTENVADAYCVLNPRSPTRLSRPQPRRLRRRLLPGRGDGRVAQRHDAPQQRVCRLPRRRDGLRGWAPWPTSYRCAARTAPWSTTACAAKRQPQPRNPRAHGRRRAAAPRRQRRGHRPGSRR